MIVEIVTAVSCLFQAAVQEPKGSIGGRVVSAQTGEGLAGATVLLSGQAGAQRLGRNSVTAADGSFQIGGLPAGDFVLHLHKSGYRPGPDLPARVSLELNQSRSKVDLRMNRPGAVVGQVTNAEGRPVVGAEVTAWRPVWTNGRRRVVFVDKVQADDRGRFRLFGLEAGNYWIGAAGPAEEGLEGEGEMTLAAYYPSGNRLREAGSVPVRWGQETAGIDLVLRAQPGFTVSGRILDAVTRGPCLTCTVAAVPADEPGESARRTWRAAADGSYRVKGLLPGSYRISVEKTGLNGATATHTVQVGNRNLREVDLIVGPERRIAGRVVLESPPPEWSRTKPSLSVTLADEAGEEEKARVAPEGTFEIRGISAGSYRVAVVGLPPEGYLKAVRTGGRDLPAPDLPVLEQGDLDSCELVIAFDAATLAGRLPSGPAANILLLPQENQSPYLLEHRARADGTGRFSLSGIAPGAYTAFAIPEGGPALEDPEVRRRYQTYGTSLRLNRNEKASVELKEVAGPQEP